MKTRISRRQERALYEVIDGMQRAKVWEKNGEEYGVVMPWRFYTDLAREYLGDAFPNVDEYQLYDLIEGKVDEEWTIRDIILWLEGSGLHTAEDRGLRFKMDILPYAIEDSKFYRKATEIIDNWKNRRK